MSYDILEKVNTPEELKAMPDSQIPELCSQVRDFLIENVGRQGGHLASNLGVVELTVAIHRVFDSPKDHFVFDVGHQSYVHKIFTGRRNRFDTLRCTGGLSGFTQMKESEHDAFGAGHSSTSISAALGYAEADRLSGSDAYTVVLLGDGAFTGGMVHEALNNCDPDLKLIIILNENGMSISVNKGRFASYLSRARISRGYMGWKRGTKTFLEHLPLIGRPLQRFLAFMKRRIKNAFFSSNYFEDLGLYYIGAVDGNNYKKIEGALTAAKRIGKCTIIHTKTVKGKGYEPAECSPDGFHSVSSAASEDETFHSVFGEELMKLAAEDQSIVAITAAMGMGTGLEAFGEKYNDRYFDVGIAEEHAVTFAAGLAAGGLKPYAAIYSTFLQRGYDNILHDVCLQNLPVRIIIDRAGLAVGDGATHHGIFDVAFLSHIPGVKIYTPATFGSLREALKLSVDTRGPVAIRYPNAKESSEIVSRFYSDGDYKISGVRASFSEEYAPECLFITYGTIADKVLRAVDIIESKGKKAGVLLLEVLKPYDEIAQLALPYIIKAKKTIFVEEGIKYGGAAMLLESELLNIEPSLSRYEIVAINDNFASPRELCDLYEYLGMSAEALAKKMMESE